MSNYTCGVYYERKTIAWCKDLGMTVTRSAGSHGLYDVIASDATRCYHIQVKVDCNPTKKEREALFADQLPPGCTKILMRWTKRNPEPDVKYLLVSTERPVRSAR